MKFDTLNKKPNLYWLLLEGFVLCLAVWLLVWDGADEHALHISLLINAFTLAAIIQLVYAFFRQLRYNPYSYNIVYYAGFAVFLLAALVMQVRITVLLARNPGQFTIIGVLGALLDSAKTYMIISFPFLFVFAVGMCVSNFELIRREGRKPANLLGIALSVLIVAGAVFLFFFDQYASGSRREVMVHDLIANLFACVYLYYECMLLGTVVADAIAARHEPEPDKSFIIILGCGLRSDGTPTPILRGRIDRALEFAAKQKELTGKEPLFVASGGQGADEVCSECEAIKRYLTEHGVPEGRIIEEDRSVNTMENMLFSKEKIAQTGIQGKIAFSTTNYHVFRSGLHARRVKMRAVGMGAKTKWYFWPNAAVREFAGLLTAHRGKQALILGSMIAFYVALTLLAYS